MRGCLIWPVCLHGILWAIIWPSPLRLKPFSQRTPLLEVHRRFHMSYAPAAMQHVPRRTSCLCRSGLLFLVAQDLLVGGHALNERQTHDTEALKLVTSHLAENIKSISFLLQSTAPEWRNVRSFALRGALCNALSRFVSRCLSLSAPRLSQCQPSNDDCWQQDLLVKLHLFPFTSFQMVMCKELVLLFLPLRWAELCTQESWKTVHEGGLSQGSSWSYPG